MVNISRKDVRTVEDFPTVKRWLRDKASKTRYSYLRNMVRLTRVAELNPDRFLAWAKTQDSLDVWDRIVEVAETFEGPGARFNFKTDMRSFLAHNGYNSLPKAKNGYSSKDWLRGYKQQELKNLVGFLDTMIEKLFVYLALETGLRAKDVLLLRYRHLKQDLEAGVLPVAVRLEKDFFGKKKSAGYTFIGSRSLSLLKNCIKDGLVKTENDSPLIPRKKDLSKPLSYSSIHDNLVLAAKKARLDGIQPVHGIRKLFEASLDRADIDHELKMMIEGHFEGTRARVYTDREWDSPHGIREAYTKAYPFVDLDSGDPELTQTVQSWQQEKAKLVERIHILEEEKKGRSSEIEDIRAELRRLREDLEKKAE